MVEQLTFKEVLPRMNYPEIEKVVKEMLRGYKLLEGKIRIREKQALGKDIGFYQEVNLSDPAYHDDKLQPLHAKLRKMKEEDYLTKDEQRLVKVVREYLTKHPVGVGSQYRTVRNIHAVNEDEAAIKELSRRLAKVVQARRIDFKSVDSIAIRRAMDSMMAAYEAEQFRMQKDLIDDVLFALRSFKPELEKLLRRRYIDDMPVEIVSEELGVTDRSYRRWKHEAIYEFATMARII